MRSINKAILIGNLTRDAELKETTGGQPIATFGIATNRAWVTREGEKNNSSEFHEVVAWGKLAEICSQYLKKGKLVYIEGYLKTRSWDTPEGVKKFRTEVVANDMIMLEKRGDKGESGELEGETAVVSLLDDENIQ
ncbi:single-stranded DNA-binding protein [Patescibacteria group bacterium]|nr:single-stranded DNA-binding protein [Patescibacteria group bacterium]MBU1703579.1 single-stranded DNA-binding protein [Patescibacteria group bacterium]MBU1954348.1 single-stranded DNA-binding protein [Patescibacteria group bacterium]